MRDLVVAAHNMRSTHNVGSLLRTAEGLGVSKVYLTGITPYPRTPGDNRLPHIAEKLTRQIDKTALGAADTQAWEHYENILDLITELKSAGYLVAALEQANGAVPLHEFKAPNKVAVLLGSEVEGLEGSVLSHADSILEIPMYGSKESYNVVQAAAMALYRLRFY